ncbi:MAG: aldehyde-activating protein [Rhizobiaceae bacterium]|nr:aldehyde-activating protein [Rhizobiaceae bacterium]
MCEKFMPQLPLTGGCQCGQLRYRVTKTPMTLYCCHCTECQGQASSAFGMSLRVAVDAVEIEGKHESFTRDTGKTSAAEGVFCPECGTRIVHRGRGEDSGSSIKAGTLDQKDWLHPVGHIWTDSAQKWLQLEGLLYPKQPDDTYKALSEAFLKQQKRR